MNKFQKWIHNHRLLNEDPNQDTGGTGTGGTEPGGEGGTDDEFIDWTLPPAKNAPAKTIKIPRQYQEALGQILARGRAEGERKAAQRYSEQLQGLQADAQSADELRAQLEELQNQSLPEAERKAKEREKALKKNELALEEERKKSQTYYDRFKETTIQNELYQALSGYDLNNPAQTMQMMRALGKADIREEDGTTRTVLTLNVDGEDSELSPKEFAETWLAQPENAFHLKANIRSGGGTSGRIAPDGAKIYSATDFRKLMVTSSPEEQAKLAAEYSAGKIQVKD